MKTAHEIYELLFDAMIRARDEAWDELSPEERSTYRINMHGIEMSVTERKKPVPTDEQSK